VFGLRPVETMGNEWSVLDLNRRYRADGWPGLNDWIVISADHSGNPMGIDPSGRVWLSDHDLGGIAPIADTFEDFIRKHCLQIA
jgi:hypothetical protein